MAVENDSSGVLDGKDQHDSKSKLPYPRSVFLIVVTEFCERFSYYGMRAVLTIYMTTMLGFSDDLATTVYHMFLLFCYGLPFFWGIVADAWLGKYKTIVIVSMIFALGNSVLTLSSVTPLHLPAATLSMLGLALMAIGTGGMKPCVAPLGGDQFTVPQQEKQLQQFFSVFFFAVSVGNMVSTVLTPILRTQVQCFGDDTCYPMAFGIPACLMICAIVIFICGKRSYKINKPEGNIALDVFRCVSYALSQKSSKKNEGHVNKPHWLDYASDKFDAKLISDIKGLLRVLIYYLPVPWFFALYEQLGSRWTLQATRMDGDLGGSFTLLPDQMQVCNAILMFIFIPVFETSVYPLFKRCNLFRRPLQKMIVGGFLAAMSFTVAGIVELQIQHSSALEPNAGQTILNVINTLPCDVNFEMENRIGSKAFIEAEGNHIIDAINERSIDVIVKIDSITCYSHFNLSAEQSTLKKTLNTKAKAVQTAVIALADGQLILETLSGEDDVKKSKEGNAKMRLVYSELQLIENPSEGGISNSLSRSPRIEIQLVNEKGSVKTFYVDSKGTIDSTTTHQIKPDKYTLLMVSNTKVNRTMKKSITGRGDVDLRTGGSYIITLHPDYFKPEDLKIHVTILTAPNEVHMLWLLPQYILMAWAEIMFMIPGMEFSFTEAPKSMKSVLQSCWHMSNAVGNIIVIISAQIESTQVTQFFVFAGLVALDMIVFAFMTSKYQYVTSEPDSEATKTQTTEKESSNSTSESTE